MAFENQMKRWREPKAKPGELKIQYGKLRHNSPDICYIGGEGTCRADRSLLHHVFSDAGIYEELEARGYDLTTLKFSIQKK